MCQVPARLGFSPTSGLGPQMAVSSLARKCESRVRATEQRLAGRRAASGARLKPDVSWHIDSCVAEENQNEIFRFYPIVGNFLNRMSGQ